MAEVSAIDKALEVVLMQIAVDCEGGDLPPSAYISTVKRVLTAALSALESEGWVLVPVEPTEAMLSAMARHNENWLSDKGPYPRSRRVYSAMLSARPKAQQEGE
jgi:hypothetical protein